MLASTYYVEKNSTQGFYEKVNLNFCKYHLFPKRFIEGSLHGLVRVTVRYLNLPNCSRIIQNQTLVNSCIMDRSVITFIKLFLAIGVRARRKKLGGGQKFAFPKIPVDVGGGGGGRKDKHFRKL